MKRRIPTRPTKSALIRMPILGTILLAAVLLPLAGCNADGSNPVNHTGPKSQSPRAPLRVEATLDIPAAGNLLTTRDRIWVISGGKRIVTQINPDTNAVTQRVKLPHPVAYGTVARGSLWLASYGENALVELDAESGRILRTLEASPDLPLNEPVGIADTKNRLWVLNHRNSLLLQIDEKTGKLTHTTRLPGDAAAGPFLVDHALWIATTAQGSLHQVDPTTGKIVGGPLQVPTGLCLWESIVGHDIWATSIKFGDFSCTNATSRVDTASGQVTPLASARGKSLYTITRYANRLWATDLHKTLYQIDPRTGSLRIAMTFDTKDTSHLFSAFGSMWVTQPEAGHVLHLRMP